MTTEITIKEWKGEPPAGAARKVRAPNHFDAPFARSLETGKSFEASIPPDPEVPRADQLKSHVKALRNAARFVNKGVDVRITEAGIWFQAREKQAPRRKKGATEQASA
jgi:hypothetical protein